MPSDGECAKCLLLTLFRDSNGRWGKHLPAFFPEGRILGVEIGCGSGSHTSIMLASHLGLHLCAIDAWTLPNPAYLAQKESSRARIMSRPGAAARFKALVVSRLKRFGGRVKMMEALSPAVADTFKANSLDFVYIDGDHSGEAVRADIEAWLPKVKPGGYICGHDYDRKKWPGLCEAVDSAARELGSPLVVKLGATPGGPEWLIEVQR